LKPYYREKERLIAGTHIVFASTLYLGGAELFDGPSGLGAGLGSFPAARC
jgi:hypothetical protein